MVDRKISFRVSHRGFTFPCFAYMTDGEPAALTISSIIPRSQPRVVHHSFGSVVQPLDNGTYTESYDEVKRSLGFLTDLLHAGVDWRSLLSARRIDNLVGRIVNGVEMQRTTRVVRESSK